VTFAIAETRCASPDFACFSLGSPADYHTGMCIPGLNPYPGVEQIERDVL